MRTGATLAWVLGTFACSTQDPIELLVPDLPEEISHFALVVSDDERTITTSALLRRPSLALVTEVDWAAEVAPGQMISLGGWREQDLGTLGPTVDPDMRLRIATPEAPALPIPHLTWRGLVGEEGTAQMSASSTPLPRLGANWLPSCERQLSESAVVDVTCAKTGCTPIPLESGCGLKIDLSVCLSAPGTRLSGGFDSAGQFWVEPGSTFAACEASSSDIEARLEVQCSDCRISVYEGFEELSAQVDIVEIEPVSGPIGGRFENRPLGYSQGLEIYDRLAVVNFKGYLPPVSELAGCESPKDGERLHAFDVETLERIWTSTVPGCLGAFTIDREREEILVAIRDTSELFRYDLEGRMLGGRSLAEDLPPPEPDQALGPVAMIVVPGSPRTLAISFEDYPGVVMLLDADTLETRHVMVLESNGLRWLLHVDEELFVVDDDHDQMIGIDVESGVLVRSQKLRSQLELQRNIAEILHHPRTDRILASHAALDAGVVSVDRALTEARPTLPPLGTAASPFGLARWTPDERFVLVALTDRSDERRTWLTLLDVGSEVSRFRPLMKEVGRGPLRYLKAGPAASIYGVFSWTGQLIRIRPRP